MHEGKPESHDLSDWVEWAEDNDSENDGGLWDFPLVSVGYVLDLLQQVRKMKMSTGEFCISLKYPKEDLSETSNKVSKDES